MISYGPFVKLPEQVQRDAVELFFYFSHLSTQALQALSAICVGTMMHVHTGELTLRFSTRGQCEHCVIRTAVSSYALLRNLLLLLLLLLLSASLHRVFALP